jgi:hypothetical protein
MDPRRRARRNLVIFWLVLIGIPVVLVGGCLAYNAGAWRDPPVPSSAA